jgi:hypothetical protein
MPPKKYGGTQRVVWSLYQAQRDAGDAVRFLLGTRPTEPVDSRIFDKSRSMEEHVGTWPDVVHFHFPYVGTLSRPFVCTEHFNSARPRQYPLNTIFLSRQHAALNHASCYVYNGLDWRRYGEPNVGAPGNYFHFIGKARQKTKNLEGAVRISKRMGATLRVLGGHRLNISKDFYFYMDTNLRFHGTVGGKAKHQLMRNSKGLIAPVRWHEPFGLVFIESLYLGSPIFATPYGSLPELVDSPDIGKLATNVPTLAEAALDIGRFDRRRCHEVAKTRFGAARMASDYRECYERVIAGESLNAATPQTDGSLCDLLPFE